MLILRQHRGSNLTVMADLLFFLKHTLKFILWLTHLHEYLTTELLLTMLHITLLTHAKYSKELKFKVDNNIFEFFLYIHLPCKKCSRNTSFLEDSSVPIQIFISHSVEKTLSYIHFNTTNTL